jgi:hypothetical protein
LRKPKAVSDQTIWDWMVAWRRCKGSEEVLQKWGKVKRLEKGLN